MDIKNLSNNWKKLQASGAISKSNGSQSAVKQKENPTNHGRRQNDSLKRRRNEDSGSTQRRATPRPAKRARKMSDVDGSAEQSKVLNASLSTHPSASNSQALSNHVNEGLAKDVDLGKYVAIDCEMVGVGPPPHLESALARVSIVNYNAEQVYDSYVKPQEEVTDWRTHVSGIQPKHMIHARSLEEVQTDIAALLKGRIVVGHSVRGDFEALFLDHPKRDIRDTARHPPFRKLAGGGSPKLKILASELLGLDIQVGEHSSIEDARATMLLFRKDKEAFEREHIKKWGPPVIVRKTDEAAADTESTKKPKKKKKKKR